MEKEFWHKIWEDEKIGFHNQEANRFLVQHFSALNLKEKSKIFVPLCGKTLDILWLLQKGYKVVGIELSQKAVEELFISLNIKPTIKTVGKLTLYSASDIEIYTGDIFDLDKSTLGKIDAVYDRAAIVALPLEMRKQYSQLMKNITACVPQLLITLVYDQSLKKGPPFSITDNELKEHYNNSYTIKLLQSSKEESFSHLNMDEKVWLLNN